MLQTLFLQSRRIVVREPNGILREANWRERDRMCQVETVSVPYTQSGTETYTMGMNLTLSLVLRHIQSGTETYTMGYESYIQSGTETYTMGYESYMFSGVR